MNIYGLTDKGMVREENQDSIGITILKNGLAIAIVCDGMGGAAGGQIASEIACNTFINTVAEQAEELEKAKFDTKKIKAVIKEGVERANAAVLARAREDLSLFGMGCTLNAAVFCKSRSKLFFANVGDSRLYMINKRAIKQLTKDHSYVQMLVDNKELTEQEAENHPHKNYITKAVGINDGIEPDIYDRRVAPKTETHFLLCSDGLHGLVKKDVLKKVALSKMSLEEKVFAYIRLANEAGGVDNISAILLSTKVTEENR